MNKEYVKELSQVRQEDFSLVGGKGANLGEMMGAGLPVPGGFVVLTSAYDTFVSHNCLGDKINDLLSSSDLSHHETLEKTASQIESWFLAGSLPKEAAAAVESIYRQQGEPVTAVRSSATAEDLPGLSFAGQYSTFLNVQGPDALLKAVRECWASLWNSRALSYRLKQGIPHHGLAHGVVVQQLIPAEKSGILFTANPVNGRRDQILLNASWGLGEAIVSGDVTPDQWVVDKNSGKVVEHRIGSKQVMTRRRQTGIELVKVPVEQQHTVTLSAAEVNHLLQLALQTEAYFGSPQDLEWAYANGTFHLVQSRPITSLFHLPASQPEREGLRLFMNINLYSQAMKEPFTPMGAQVIEAMVRDVMRRMGKKDANDPEALWFLHNLGGRLFIDVTEVLHNPKSWRKFENNPADKDPLTSQMMLQLLHRERQEITGRKGARFLKALNRHTLRFGLGALKKFKTGQRSADQGRISAIHHGDAMVAHLKKQVRQLNTLEDRLQFIENSVGDLFFKGFEIIFYVAASSTYIEKAKKRMASCLTDLSDLQAVEKAVPHSVTTEMGMAILEMARELDGLGQRASENTPQLRKFLQRYGHRNTIELDVGIPTWKEDPAYVVDLVNTYIDSNTYQEGLERFEKAQADAEAAIERIHHAMTAAGKAGSARKVKALLTDFRAMFGVRELSKFYLRHGLSIYRETLLEAGQELVSAGKLAVAEDIFFVTFSDLRSHADLKALAAANREQYAREMDRKAPRVLTSTGESFHAPMMKPDANALLGVPVSPGVYEGQVKVLHHPEEGKSLQVGDILVTTGTNPAWTPLFLKLGGLIMETGGPISHGSVVAREYGLPAVAGVADATRLLQNGQRVRLNGETGTVELMQAEEVLA